MSEEYSAKNATLTVKWTQEAMYTYSFSVSPLANLVHIGNTSLQLILQYNTKYNLSVVAAAPCRENVTTSITLNYGE